MGLRTATAHGGITCSEHGCCRIHAMPAARCRRLCWSRRCCCALSTVSNDGLKVCHDNIPSPAQAHHPPALSVPRILDKPYNSCACIIVSHASYLAKLSNHFTSPATSAWVEALNPPRKANKAELGRVVPGKLNNLHTSTTSPCTGAKAPKTPPYAHTISER